ncbi:hypothetical protein NJ76_27415 [Rhodococcus sp. IITR03]|nr:hypothetical protein NJ76_27415 [Rhodococcus sp. IITR03]
MIVVPGIDSGQPAARTEYRPMLLDWSPTCETQPHTTSSTTGIDTRALGECLQDVRRQIRRMLARQSPVALADRRADGLDDDCFTHVLLLHS